MPPDKFPLTGVVAHFGAKPAGCSFLGAYIFMGCPLTRFTEITLVVPSVSRSIIVEGEAGAAY